MSERELFEFDTRDEPTIANKVGQAIGAASMCWSETPSGVFDSTRARGIVDALINAIEDDANDRESASKAVAQEQARRLERIALMAEGREP
jgi:hypothetical protein